MAVEGESKDLKAHERSYDLFTWMMKWGAIVCAVIGFLVILAIAN